MPKNRITKPFFKVFKKKHSILILKPPREALILARGKPLSRSPSLPWMTASEDALTWEQVKDRGSICWRKSPPLAYGLLDLLPLLGSPASPTVKLLRSPAVVKSSVPSRPVAAAASYR